MASSIWKFEITAPGPLNMPVGAKILSIGEQNDRIMVWALVDTEAEVETVVFDIYGTGYVMPDDRGEYIGTVHLHNGTLVFHVFKN